MTSSELAAAVKMLRGLGAAQAQCALTVQADMCAPVVEAVGCYDLADLLRKISATDETDAHGPRTPDEWAEWGRHATPIADLRSGSRELCDTVAARLRTIAAGMTSQPFDGCTEILALARELDPSR